MPASTPGLSTITETVSTTVVPIGGNVINVTPSTVQNRKLMPLADLVSQNTLWLLECESNNVGSVKDPKDVINLNAYVATLLRQWERTKKNNRGGGDTQFETTHGIAFAALGELQGMPNTPCRHLAYLNWHLFRTLLEKQGSKMQVFIDATAIDDISSAILEIEEFIADEFGDGVATTNGKFNTGFEWPDFSRLGTTKPSLTSSTIVLSEGSSAPPPATPSDTPDIGS